MGGLHASELVPCMPADTCTLAHLTEDASCMDVASWAVSELC